MAIITECSKQTIDHFIINMHKNKNRVFQKLEEIKMSRYYQTTAMFKTIMTCRFTFKYNCMNMFDTDIQITLGNFVSDTNVFNMFTKLTANSSAYVRIFSVTCSFLINVVLVNNISGLKFNSY